MLCATVARGPASITWEQHGFAVADDFVGGRYVEPVTGAEAPAVVGTSLVVRPDLAQAQLTADEARTAVSARETAAATSTAIPRGTGGTEPEPDDRLRRFYAAAELDPERSQRDFGKIATEIITNLASQLGTEIRITVEIHARNDDGFTDQVVRTVSENARTLKVDDSGFEHG